jgi:hypothetical protein
MNEEAIKAMDAMVVLSCMMLGALCGVFLGEYLGRRPRDK